MFKAKLPEPSVEPEATSEPEPQLEYVVRIHHDGTDSFPWRWKVHLPGTRGSFPTLYGEGYVDSGMASFQWGARLAARLCVRKHRKRRLQKEHSKIEYKVKA